MATQNNLDSDGSTCETPQVRAVAATKHFTDVFNIVRERPGGSAEAVAGVTQREVRVGLDDPITFDEFTKVLRGAKNSKATPNQVPIEVLEATITDSAAVGLLFSYTPDVLEQGRAAEHLFPPPPPEPPPPPLQVTAAAAKQLNAAEGGSQGTERTRCRRQSPLVAMPVAAGKFHSKEGAPKGRYALYCSTKTHAEAITVASGPNQQT